MFQVSKLKTFGRVVFLVFLLATTMGPWFADSHPATEESCSRPPLPALSPLVWLGDGYCACLITLKGYVVEGALYGLDVMWLLCLPPALPVLSTLLLLLFQWRAPVAVGLSPERMGNSRYLRVPLVRWSLVCAPGGTDFMGCRAR